MDLGHDARDGIPALCQKPRDQSADMHQLGQFLLAAATMGTATLPEIIGDPPKGAVWSQGAR